MGGLLLGIAAIWAIAFILSWLGNYGRYEEPIYARTKPSDCDSKTLLDGDAIEEILDKISKSRKVTDSRDLGEVRGERRSIDS